METNEKRARNWLIPAVLVCGLAGAAVAQDDKLTDEQLLEEGLVKKEAPFEVTLGLNWRAYLFEHSALQTRSDRENDHSEDWRKGNTDGSGWGVILSVERLTSKIEGSITASSYDYDLKLGGLRHSIETDRRDLDLNWQEQTGHSERGRWGWLLGVRYITLDEQYRIEERKNGKGRAEVLDDNGDIQWFMAQAGYWGDIQPFQRPFMKIYGNARLLLGEARGTARFGSDGDPNDGNIEEHYDDEYSVSYGLNGTLGVAFRIRQSVGLNLEYTREWLYSFESTGSGIVVFPDNNDALFIESWHGVAGYLTINW